MTTESAPGSAARRTACAWCHGEVETDRPWRLDEYQVHSDCLPALDEYREKLQALMRVRIHGENE